jgi:hypothetical protein
MCYECWKHNPMEQSPWETDNHSTGQEMSCCSWNQKVHYIVHNITPLSQVIQATPSHPISFRSAFILVSHLRLGLPSGLLSLDFPAKMLRGFLIPSIRATFLPHLILLHFITVIIFGEEYKLWNSLCNFFSCLVTSSPLGPNTLLSTLLLYTHNFPSSLGLSDHVSHPYITTGKIIVRPYVSVQVFS